jgi:hypothetical protein
MVTASSRAEIGGKIGGGLGRSVADWHRLIGFPPTEEMPMKSILYIEKRERVGNRTPWATGEFGCLGSATDSARLPLRHAGEGALSG